MNLGYLAAVVVLGGIILFHEFGHYLLARLNGVAVVEFSVGFGPRLLSWVSKKTGIRYSLKLLPLGGSCAMLGEFGEDEDEKEEIPDVKGVSGDVFPSLPQDRFLILFWLLCSRL